MAAGDLEDGKAAYDAGNYQKAFRLFKPLAEQGNAYSQNNLRWVYANGEGVHKEDIEAVYWWLKISE